MLWSQRVDEVLERLLIQLLTFLQLPVLAVVVGKIVETHSGVGVRLAHHLSVLLQLSLQILLCGLGSIGVKTPLKLDYNKQQHRDA